MAIRDEDFGSALTLVEGDDGLWSPPVTAPACAPPDLHLLYEQEVNRAKSAEARVQELLNDTRRLRRALRKTEAGGRTACPGRPREGGQRPRTMRPRRSCTGPLARKFRSGCSTAWPAPGCALRSAPRWISPRCPLSHRSCRMRWVNPWRRAQDGSSMTRIGERPMPDRHRVHRKRGKGSEQLDLFGRVESSSPHPPESLRSSFPPLNRGEGAPMSRPVG